jgi:hypothetical protein
MTLKPLSSVLAAPSSSQHSLLNHFALPIFDRPRLRSAADGLLVFEARFAKIRLIGGAEQSSHHDFARGRSHQPCGSFGGLHPLRAT